MILPLLLLLVSFLISPDSVSVTSILTIEAPPAYTNTYSTILWSPDSRFIAVSFTKREMNSIGEAVWYIYDVESKERLHRFASFIGWFENSQRVIARPENDAPPQIMDVRTGEVLATLAEGEIAGSAEGLGVTPQTFGDTVMVIDNTSRLHLYDSKTYVEMITIEDVQGFPVFAHDRYAIVIESGIQIRDTESNQLLYMLDGYTLGSWDGNVWSPDAAYLLVSANQSGIRFLWNSSSGALIPLGGKSGSVSWSANGEQIAVGSQQAEVRIYEVESGQLLQTVESIPQTPTFINSWEGRYLVFQSGDNINTRFMLHVWSLEHGEMALSEFVDTVYSYQLEGDRIKIYEPGKIRTFDLNSGMQTDEHRFAVNNNKHQLFSTYFSPDCRWTIATDSPFDFGVTAPIYLYRNQPFEQIEKEEAHTSIVRYIAWSPNSRRFASVGDPNGMIIVWKLD